MTIRTKSSPNLISQPVVNFDKNSFDATLWNKGYNVLHEESRPCPCRSKNSGSPLPNCQNCRGFGWVFINPIRTKALVSNINKKQRYVEWSEETIGTISATLMNDDKLAEMDRITFLEVVSKRSEILKIRESSSQKFVFLTYKPNEILDVFYFESSSTPLIKLTESQYGISSENEYILLLNFTEPSGFNGVVTVGYLCNPSYIIIDLPHDLRASMIMNSMGQLEKIDLPINAILRKTHIMFGVNDYIGGIKTLDNSYK